MAMEILHENNNKAAMEFKLEFQLNLQRISTVRVATMLLDRPLVKDMIEDVFLRHWKAHCPNTQIKDVDVQRIITQSLDQLDSCQLPSALLNGVRIVTQSLVLKMFSWYDLVAKTLEFDDKKTVSCIRKICWTDYGTINYKKTFELVWINNLQLSSSDRLDMASNFCFVDYIKNHLNEYPQQQCVLSLYWHEFFAGTLKTDDREHLHMSTSFKFRDEIESARRHCTNRYCIYNNDKSENVNRFFVAVYRGNYDAVKFRWSKLTDEERRMYIVPVTVKLINQEDYPDHHEGYIETCVFLLNEMSHQDWVNFVKIKTDAPLLWCPFNYPLLIFPFLTRFFVLWPWNKFFVPILKKLWAFPALWCYLLTVTDLMTNIICNHHKWYMTSTQWTMLLSHIWLAVPKNIKLLANFFSYETLLIHLIQNDQMQLVKLILRDVDLMEIKLELTIGIARKCLLNERSIFKSHQVEAFFNLVPDSAEEREHLIYHASRSICI